MSEPSRRDAWRAVRRTVAQVSLLFTVLLLWRVALALFGSGKGPHLSPVGWALWSMAVALMVTASVLAVLTLRTADPRRSWRFATWCGGLWIVGFVLIVLAAPTP